MIISFEEYCCKSAAHFELRLHTANIMGIYQLWGDGKIPNIDLVA